jgi:hypothetical protein
MCSKNNSVVIIVRMVVGKRNWRLVDWARYYSKCPIRVIAAIVKRKNASQEKFERSNECDSCSKQGSKLSLGYPTSHACTHWGVPDFKQSPSKNIYYKSYNIDFSSKPSILTSFRRHSLICLYLQDTINDYWLNALIKWLIID